MRTALGVVIDAVIICLFAAIGRRNHGETSALAGLIRSPAPASEHW